MAQAQTPQDKADALLANFMPQVAAKMDIYLQQQGRYFQGIRTPVIIPPNGASAPVNETVKPTDQLEDWNY